MLQVFVTQAMWTSAMQKKSVNDVVKKLTEYALFVKQNATFIILWYYYRFH